MIVPCALPFFQRPQRRNPGADGSNWPPIQRHPGTERGDAAEQRDSAADKITPQLRIIQKSITSLQMHAARIDSPLFQTVHDVKEPFDLRPGMRNGFSAQVIRFIKMGIKAGNLKMRQRIVPRDGVQILRGFTQTVHPGVHRQMCADRTAGLIQLTGLIVTG